MDGDCRLVTHQANRICVKGNDANGTCVKVKVTQVNVTHTSVVRDGEAGDKAVAIS